MAIKVTVNSVPTTRVSVNDQKRETIRTVGIGLGIQNPSIITLSDVDASSKNDNDTLVYNASTGKFVVTGIPTLNGGTF
jgi:hypothetical protein